MSGFGYPPVPTQGNKPESLADAASRNWLQVVAEKVNYILRGRMNVVTQVTLAANAGTTTLTDSRISATNGLLLQPLTSNAAGALATTYWSAQGIGSATLTHANNTQTDRKFNVLIIG